MKYLLFANYFDGSEGAGFVDHGWNDFESTSNSIDELVERAQKFDWWHIVDTKTLKIVLQK